ncbi:MAG: ABC transporter substrate-binding protein [Proteobacteria bacterium]|nr:ABC transporter substrate-binding protein [Pseudomonadota bacterium]
MKTCVLRRNILCVLIFVGVLAVPSWADDANTGGNPAGRYVVDCAGRKVTLPETIKRIACLYAFAGHAVTMMGRGDDIVAVAKGLKRDSLLLEICPSILNARVPKSQGGINMEELLKAKPDLVFVSADVGQNTGETSKLEAFHIPYLIVDYASITEQQNAVAMIGQALDATGKADAYIRYYNDTIQKVHSRVSLIREDRKLRIYHSVNEANRTTIPRSLSTDWLNVLGVINVACKKKESIIDGHNGVVMEQILIWNPDVILVNEPSVKKQILLDRRWAPLEAVKTKKVFLLPIAISRWGHPGSLETPLAIGWAAKMLYPETFRDIDLAHETRNFYKTFFNYDLSDTEVNQILDGKRERIPKKRG